VDTTASAVCACATADQERCADVLLVGKKSMELAEYLAKVGDEVDRSVARLNANAGI
jgi:hypothetical protein